jgi:hypothetical protein
MKKILLFVVPFVSVLVGCAGSTAGPDDETDTVDSVIEDIAVAPVTPPVPPVEPPVPPVEPPVPPVEPPVPPVPPVEPPVPPVEPPPPVNPPVVVEPHRGWAVARACSNRMQTLQQEHLPRSEHVFWEPRNNIIAVRWKITDEDWAVFIADDRFENPPRCRLWRNDSQGRPQEQ